LCPDQWGESEGQKNKDDGAAAGCETWHGGFFL
jgi:hypothetical protein